MIFSRSIFALPLGVVLSVVTPTPGLADLITYNSEAAFLAAVGSGVGQENFSEDAAGTVFPTGQGPAYFYNNNLVLYGGQFQGPQLLASTIVLGPYGYEFETDPALGGGFLNDDVITGEIQVPATYFGFDYSAYSYSNYSRSLVPVGAFITVPGNASQVSGAYQGVQVGPFVQFSVPATGFFGVIADSPFIAGPPCQGDPFCYNENLDQGIFTLQAANASDPLSPYQGQPILYNFLLNGGAAIGTDNPLVPDLGAVPEPGTFMLSGGIFAVAFLFRLLRSFRAPEGQP
jgi:hypothetical protein